MKTGKKILYSSLATATVLGFLAGAQVIKKNASNILSSGSVSSSELFERTPTPDALSLNPDQVYEENKETTDTPTSTVEMIEEPTPTQEQKSSTISKLEEKVNEIRLSRASYDVDYVDRINPDLAEKYVANILFLGKKEDRGTGPADTYIIMSIKDDLEIDVTSLPRDLFTPESSRRLNVYLGYPEEPPNDWFTSYIQPSLIPLVENITGIPIDYYLILSSENLIVDMADVLGGLDITIENTVYDVRFNILYEEGDEIKNFKGEKLASFIKTRADSATQRMNRQVQVGKAIFRQLLGNLKEKPVKTLFNVGQMYFLMKDYEQEGKLEFNTSSPEIDQSLNSMYDMGVAMLKDVVNDRASMPAIGNMVNTVDLGMYLPWDSEDRSHAWWAYKTTIDEQYSINTYIINSTRSDGTVNLVPSKDMMNLVNNLYTNNNYIENPTIEDLDLALKVAREEYYMPLRLKLADALLEN